MLPVHLVDRASRSAADVAPCALCSRKEHEMTNSLWHAGILLGLSDITERHPTSWAIRLASNDVRVEMQRTHHGSSTPGCRRPPVPPSSAAAATSAPRSPPCPAHAGSPLAPASNESSEVITSCQWPNAIQGPAPFRFCNHVATGERHAVASVCTIYCELLDWAMLCFLHCRGT